MTDVAVTGIDCRFPGAPDPTAFWQLLVNGGNAVSEVPAARWDADSVAPGRTNTRSGGFVNDPDTFDNAVFGIAPLEAAAMDPQQRILLECSWRALEDAGVDPKAAHLLRTGVFLGIIGNEWAALTTAEPTDITPYTGAGNGHGMAANRISYHFNLNGPSLAVDTACSSSLVAVHLACQSLRTGECDRAIAAGVNLILTPAVNIFYAQAGLSAPDGRCKPFSAAADGIGRADGVGVVVLRRLEDAVAADEPIYAVIRGSAVNQDGRSNGFTAPSRWAQIEVVEQAYARARVVAEQVRFIEAHGTGTVLGDMIETRALGQVHGIPRPRPCLIGSVKGNIGHAEGAAGIAGLIKVALALHHRLVPPSLGANPENPQLRLAAHGLAIATAATPLPDSDVVASVSSFGLGGTNAHLVLASGPGASPGSPAGPWSPADHTDAAPPAVYTLSGTDIAAVQRNAAAHAIALQAGTQPLPSACYTSNRIKASLPWRLAVAGVHRTQLTATLETVAGDQEVAEQLCRRRPSRPPRVGFLFTGQGAQHPGMTRALLEGHPPYRAHLEEVDRALRESVGTSIIELICSGSAEIGQTRLAQPAIFAVEYALGRMLIDLGVAPKLMLGHSVGEYAAACLSGVLPLAEASRLIALRGALMHALPVGGGMLAARCGAEEIAELVADRREVSVASVNGPHSVVLSGALEVLAELDAALGTRAVPTSWLDVSHAFHSRLMSPVLTEFSAAALPLRPETATVPLVSTVTGRPVDDTPMDGAYWTRHIMAPVLFAEAVAHACSAGVTHLVELGPRRVLGPLVRQIPAARNVRCLSVASSDVGPDELAQLVADLVRDGFDPNWDSLYAPPDRAMVPLPRYVFTTGTRYWPGSGAAFDAGRTHHQTPTPGGTRSASVPLTGPAARRGPGSNPAGVAADVVAAICGVCGHEPAAVTLSARLHEDLGFDSMMVMALKRELEARIPAFDSVNVKTLLPHITSVGDLVAFAGEHALSPAS